MTKKQQYKEFKEFFRTRKKKDVVNLLFNLEKRYEKLEHKYNRQFDELREIEINNDDMEEKDNYIEDLEQKNMYFYDLLVKNGIKILTL